MERQDEGNSDGRRALALTVAFLCVAAAGMAVHEMWRDEWQAWMLARDSVSFLDLLRNLRHEGHPPGWNFLLFVFSRWTRDPLVMQGAHLAIAATSVYLIARYSRLAWLHKVLLAFGYFLAYEYAVIARQYGLGALALFAFCALVPVRQRHPIAVFFALLVLASTSAYGLILSVAAGGMLLVEAMVSSDGSALRWLRRRSVKFGVLAWLAGLAIVAVAIRPPTGFGEALGAGGTLSRWSLATSFSTITRAYLPLPDLEATHVWNSHFLATDTRSALAMTLALALIMSVGAVLLFLRKPAVLFLYLAGTTALLAFRHLVFVGSMRHDGHLFLLFVACLWLASLPLHEWRLPGRLERTGRLERWTRPRGRPASLFITCILLGQVAAAALLYNVDARENFSAAPDVAEFIRAEGLEHLPMGASPAPPASSVAGLLDRQIYYLAMGSDGTFVNWSRYPNDLDMNITMDYIRPFIDGAGTDVLLILARTFHEWDPDLEVEELGHFPARLEHREGYVIYRVRRQEPG